MFNVPSSALIDLLSMHTTGICRAGAGGYVDNVAMGQVVGMSALTITATGFVGGLYINEGNSTAIAVVRYEISISGRTGGELRTLLVRNLQQVRSLSCRCGKERGLVHSVVPGRNKKWQRSPFCCSPRPVLRDVLP